MAMKGLSSIEYLFVTGLALMALVAVAIISTNIGSDSIRVTQTRDTVEKLANSADYVYSLGPGSKETVSVSLPSGVKFITVSDDRIHARVALSSGDSDVYAKSKGARLIGAVAALAGQQQVTITALSDGSVLFGNALLLCDPARVSLNVNKTSTDRFTLVNVTNIDYENNQTFTGLSASVSGSVRNITVQPEPTVSPDQLAPGNRTQVRLDFNPAGEQEIYSGMLQVQGSNNSRCFSEIFVNTYDQKEESGLNTADNRSPDLKLEYCGQGELRVSADDTWGETEPNYNAIVSCSYMVDDGDWSSNMTPVPPSYYGWPIVYVSASLDPDASEIHVKCKDAMGNGNNSLYINAAMECSAGNDARGPDASNATACISNGTISRCGNFTNFDHVTVNANCDDTLTGGSPIHEAEVSFDNGTTWSLMEPLPGSLFDVFVSMGVGYTTPFGMAAKSYVASVRCTDIMNNSNGTVANVAFSVTSDSAGPVIMDMTDPGFVTTINDITILPTATDSYTGNNNVASCQWMMSGSGTGCSPNVGWTAANASDGAFDSPTETFLIALGKLNACAYIVQAYCVDSIGNNGSVREDNITVSMGDIVLVMDRSGSMNDSLTQIIPWTNPANASASDNSYATVSLGNMQQSDYLQITDFNFNIPAGATITGIEVRVKRKASANSQIKDDSVLLMKNGAIGTTNKAGTVTWTISDATITYGSSTDLWGDTWTASDINNAGVAFAAQGTSTATTASVDYVSMTVYYTQ